MKDLYKYYLKDNCAWCGKRITKKMIKGQEVLELILNHSIDETSWDGIWKFLFCDNRCFKKGIKKLVKEEWLISEKVGKEEKRCKLCGYKIRKYPSGLIKERHKFGCKKHKEV
ncbi:MAG: hypothetical protein ACFFG0_40310 [Candidatus Thorarchaeota archaeon]